MADASIKDVAALAGVSVGTVSNVTNSPDKVTPQTTALVHAAIGRLGFVRNDAARQLRAGHSRAIGLIVLNISNPFFAELARGAEQRAEQSGFSILLGNSDQQTGREANYLDLFREQRVHGVLISPVSDKMQITTGSLSHVPLVIVDRDASALGLPWVAVDDRAGGALAATHLVESGSKRICFVGGHFESVNLPTGLKGHDRYSPSKKAQAWR